MARHRVLVTTRLFDDRARAFLMARGCELVDAGLPQDATDGHLGAAELAPLLRDVDGWIIGVARLDDAILNLAPDLKIVARRGVGFDRVDVAAAAARGLVVTTAPGGNEPSVADHTISLMLAAASRLNASHRALQGGDWGVQDRTELYRKTVGLLGCGRIGRQVVQRLRGFETRILVCDPAVDAAEASRLGVEVATLPELLHEADFISLHLPITEQTRHIIDASAIGQMKHGAIVVNTARGGLIDEAALLAALRDGRLAGAGLDVFEDEGASPLDDRTLALLQHSGVIATPHAAGSSREGLERTNLIAAQCVLAVLDGGSPPQECVIADGRAAGPAGRRSQMDGALGS